VTDRGLCPDPGHITARFAEEFEKLQAVAPRRRAKA
jgi:hypothetical protein